MKIGCSEVPKPTYPSLLWLAEWKAPAPLRGVVHELRDCNEWGGRGGRGISKWLQYHIRVVRKNDYGIWWILGEYKRNNISIDFTKISYFSVFIFWGMLKWLHYYMIALFDGGALGAPKSDCVIYVRLQYPIPWKTKSIRKNDQDQEINMWNFQDKWTRMTLSNL